MLSFEQMLDESYQYLERESKCELLVLPTFDIDVNVVRLHWKNIEEYLNKIKRTSDHFMTWLKQELPNKPVNWYSATKSEGIIIHGKRQKKVDVIDLAIKYVNAFVLCSSCKSPNTTMTKDASKNYEFACMDCKMTLYKS